MSDAAFKTGKYPGYSTAQLREFVAEQNDRSPGITVAMQAEIARREAVAAGDTSQMTPGERLRHREG